MRVHTHLRPIVLLQAAKSACRSALPANWHLPHNRQFVPGLLSSAPCRRRPASAPDDHEHAGEHGDKCEGSNALHRGSTDARKFPTNGEFPANSHAVAYSEQGHRG